MSQQILFELKGKFENWRAERVNKNAGTPDYLKKEVVSLLGKVTPYEIVRSLKITYRQIYAWQKELNPIPLHYTKTCIPLNIQNEKNIFTGTDEKNSCVAEIEFKNGSKIRIFAS